ncbi:MAG: hypothetical protein IH608_12055 [Proteobacteria bacterium]|nr:hypothetical protein [Pseudomonadota bacterium]
MEESAVAAQLAEHHRANPGDFECPHCRYVTLKREASRCPMCHGEVSRGYWEDVRAKELADELEYARTAPQREAARKAEEAVAAAATEVTRRNARRDRVAEGITAMAGLYFVYLLPLLTYGTAAMAQGASLRDLKNWSTVVALVPLLNWIWCLFAFFFSAPERRAFFVALGSWAMVGVVAFVGAHLILAARRE